ncbi:MAG: DNA-3-methyladenine glycosylase [Acidimicrobiia bacterium]
MTKKLRELLNRPLLQVAPALLGMRLRTEQQAGVTEIELVEVEAYGGVDDPASHAYRGPKTRNASMFRPAGTLYVYRSHGVHWCANVATGPEGVGQAVLLRGGVPAAGLDLMRARRGRDDHLSDGPGKLTQALGITGKDDGIDLLARGRVQLLPGQTQAEITTTPRVGISVAKERPWRFVLS